MSKFNFWRTITDAVYCFTLYPYILHHKYRTHKYSEAVDEKFGKVTPRHSNNNCLQLHAVSVGEVIAAQPIISEFRKTFPDWDIHITVSTATGREVALKRYSNIPVSFFPLDLTNWVELFFQRIRPTAIILMELEAWPNFLSLSSEYNIPVIVANGRITEKSADAYRKHHWFPILRKMLNTPALWLAQNNTYYERFKDIGITKDKIKTIGSVKYDTIPTEPDQAIRERYRTILNTPKGHRIIIAGSTHNPEEKILLDSYKELKLSQAVTQLVIVPRHPHRFEEVYQLATAYGKCTKYSTIEDSQNNEKELFDIVIIDKMGILSELYNAGDIVFIGGTFINHGGQSMLEPCGLGKPTIIGPSYYNFTDTVNFLKEVQGIKIVEKPDKLSETINNLLSDSQAANRLANAGRIELLKHKGCSQKTIELLKNIIETHTLSTDNGLNYHEPH